MSSCLSKNKKKKKKLKEKLAISRIQFNISSLVNDFFFLRHSSKRLNSVILLLLSPSSLFSPHNLARGFLQKSFLLLQRHDNSTSNNNNGNTMCTTTVTVALAKNKRKVVTRHFSLPCVASLGKCELKRNTELLFSVQKKERHCSEKERKKEREYGGDISSVHFLPWRVTIMHQRKTSTRLYSKKKRKKKKKRNESAV